MTPPLETYLDKTVLVGLPALFGDVRCRPCRLVNVAPNGLWLEIEDLAERVLPHEALSLQFGSLTMFVPFAQISCVIGAAAHSDKPFGATAVPLKQEEKQRPKIKKHN